jgi:hypothetical protein
MASMPQRAPVITGHDMPEELARIRMNCTTSFIDSFTTKL